MPRKGLMIDYEYCSGCRACEVACKQEHGYSVGKGGIHLNEITTELPSGRIRIDYVPFPTAYCDMCADRSRRGESPACVKHCQSSTIYHGLVSELAKMMEDMPHSVLFTMR